MFVTGESPTEQELIDSMSGVEFVLEPGQAHHYSNLAFALLGQVVAARLGRAVHGRTSTAGSSARSGSAGRPGSREEPFAQGYLVDEYARTVWLEPATELKGTAAAGQLWSTVGDLAAGRRSSPPGTTASSPRRRSRRCGSRR